MKKLLSILLVLAMVLALMAGCGKTEEAPATEAAPAPETEAAPAPEAEGEAEVEAADPGFDKLDLVLFTGGYGDLWAEMVELFKSYYPNVEVTADLGDDVNTRIRTRMMTDTPPDVILNNGTNEYDIYEAARSGMIMELSDFFANGTDADGNPMSEVMSPAKLVAGTIDGGLYLPAWGAGYCGWFYNAALFEENGWTVPSAYEDLYTLKDEITASGSDVIPLMYQSINYPIWGFLYQAIAAGGGYQTYADCFINLKEGAWSSEGALAGVKMIDQLVKDGILSQTSVAIEFTQAQIDFVNDRVALIPCGTWFENEMKESTPEGFEMTFIPVPVQDAEGHHFVTALNNFIAIPAGALNPEAAKAFLGVLYSVEGQKLVTKYGSLPVSSTVTNDDIAEYLTPTTETILAEVNAGNIVYVSNDPEYWYAAMWPDLQDAITNLVLQEITAEEFCAQMEEAAKRLREDDSIYKYSA